MRELSETYIKGTSTIYSACLTKLTHFRPKRLRSVQWGEEEESAGVLEKVLYEGDYIYQFDKCVVTPCAVNVSTMWDGIYSGIGYHIN